MFMILTPLALTIIGLKGKIWRSKIQVTCIISP